jgi:transposase-like protein
MKSNEIKNKAYELVMVQEMQQKEVAVILGVAENTIGRWAKVWRKAPMVKKPTVESIADIMSDICKIEDNNLRNSITDKLLKMISNTSNEM